MCDTCNQARKLPQIDALKLIANTIGKRGSSDCLDRIIGELVGEPEPVVNRAAERAFENRKRK